MKLLLALAALSSALHAQTVSLRPVETAPAIRFSAISPLAAGSVAPSLAPAPSLTPALAASVPSPLPVSAVPAALTPASAAASTPEAEKPRSTAAQRDSEFKRLVADLMGTDKDKADAAGTALRALKEQHLNAAPEGKKTRVLDLKPMQIPAGMLEVQDKARDLRDLKEKDAESWLKERSVPILEDYKNRKRPVDHHHEARAAWEADKDEVFTHRYFDDEMHARIKALPREQYYAVTRAMRLFYDRDQFGAGPHDPNHLPEDVRGMADDPFRSVAWQVRKRGGYDKSPVPFAEFAWAQFFRERVKTYPTKADFEQAVLEAMKLVHSSEAKDLPGWKPK
jgi:hypothetical protein